MGMNWGADIFANAAANEPLTKTDAHAIPITTHPASTAGAFPGAHLHIRFANSIAEFQPEVWDNLFPGRAENWNYFRACEQMDQTTFQLHAMGAFSGERLVGALLIFRQNYRWDMSLGARTQRLVGALTRLCPQTRCIGILGIGSPYSEECPIGFAPGLSQTQKREILRALLAGVERQRAAWGLKVTAFKDLAEQDASRWQAELQAAGLVGIRSLPLATLSLPHADLDAYIACLGANARKDLKRKIKQSRDVRVEFRDSLAGIEPEVRSLYRQTQANRKRSYDGFDEVPESYFARVMAANPGRAKVLLAWVGDELAAFNLFLAEEERVIGKFIGMRQDMARRYNLYFVNWLAMVRYCIDQGIPHLQSGQTSYGVKVRLGSKLKRSWIYCRYAGRLGSLFLRLFGPGLAFDKSEPDLVRLTDKEDIFFSVVPKH